MKRYWWLFALLLLAAANVAAAQDTTTISMDSIAAAANSPAGVRIHGGADTLILKFSADTTVRAACLDVVDGRPDSVVITGSRRWVDASSCPLAAGLLVFARDTAITNMNLSLLAATVLWRAPHLILACVGRREGPGWVVVPQCRVRT